VTTRYLPILFTLVGCSSSYQPANSPRISIAASAGSTTFYKEGKEYPAGFFLGGVEDAVRGNPRAEREARTAGHLMVAGWVCNFVAIGALASGTALLATSHGSDKQEEIGLGLILGSLVPDIAAFILFVNAPPHMYDAINIYNDGVLPAPTVAPSALAPVVPIGPPLLPPGPPPTR